MKRVSFVLPRLAACVAVLGLPLFFAACKFGEQQSESDAQAVKGGGYILAFSGDQVTAAEFAQEVALDSDLLLRSQKQQQDVQEKIKKSDSEKEGFYVGRFTLCPETTPDCSLNPFQTKGTKRPVKLIPLNFESIKSNANLKAWPGYVAGGVYYLVGGFVPGIPALVFDFYAGLFKGNLFSFNELKAVKKLWLTPAGNAMNWSTAEAEIVKHREAIFDAAGVKSADVKDARAVARALAEHLKVDYTGP